MTGLPMIIDLPRFIAARAAGVDGAGADRSSGSKRDPAQPLTLEEAKRFHFLYQKVSADLGRIATFASEPELRALPRVADGARLCGDSRDARTRRAVSAGALVHA